MSFNFNFFDSNIISPESKEMKMICSLVVAVLLAAGVSSMRTVDTVAETVTAAPCAVNWTSQQNQTFSFFAIGTGAVQLRAWYGNNHACLCGVNNTNAATLSLACCAARESVWTYGPGSIKTYVYFNNSVTSGKCLTLKMGKHDLDSSLTFESCCHSQGANCTQDAKAKQAWLEPPTTHNPYSIMQTMFKSTLAPKGYCLTRFGQTP